MIHFHFFMKKQLVLIMRISNVELLFTFYFCLRILFYRALFNVMILHYMRKSSLRIVLMWKILQTLTLFADILAVRKMYPHLFFKKRFQGLHFILTQRHIGLLKECLRKIFDVILTKWTNNWKNYSSINFRQKVGCLRKQDSQYLKIQFYRPFI